MKTQIPFLAAFLVATPLGIHAMEPVDPERWFVEDYGALWLEAPWNNTEAILGQYTARVLIREPGSAPSTVSARDWLAPLLSQWREEGWVSSGITALKTDRINNSTVVFKTRWMDAYSDGSTESSCGWYLADLLDGAWKTTEYATIDCADHGLEP